MPLRSAPHRRPARRPRADPRRALGALGEELAAAHLQRLGFVVLARNVRTRHGEIDLIAFDGRTLVFAEVKTRRVSAAARRVRARAAAAGMAAPAPARAPAPPGRARGCATSTHARPTRPHDPLRRDRRDRRRARTDCVRLDHIEGGVVSAPQTRRARAPAAGRPATGRTSGAAARRPGAGSPRGARAWSSRRARRSSSRVLRVGVAHVAVARDLGDDRRRRDRGAGGVAVDDRPLGPLELGHREAVERGTAPRPRRRAVTPRIASRSAARFVLCRPRASIPRTQRETTTTRAALRSTSG